MFTLPNLLTATNLFLGCCALVSLAQGNDFVCLILVLAAAAVDFLDGFVARAMGQQSELGVQLDSLSDVVSFGVVPGMICYQVLASSWPEQANLAYLGFLIPVMAAFRLARFNLNASGKDAFFQGLPVPANALFFLGILHVKHADPDLHRVIYEPIVFLLIVALFGFLMISNIRILKIHPTPAWLKKYGYVLFLEGLALASWYWIGATALSLAVLVHLFLSLFIQYKNHEIIYP
ncbi:MAG TPA: CDP-diacylglycerol--serine O-phosphatidyltransferase [Saprospiraceae bacterium]|nr:CDP-diacylglycerol--serine O-phosphatidyltransferase [Saprospiraceae bacterium]